MRRQFRDDDYTPWSFVVPIALAVMLGILAADVVRLMVGAMIAKAAISELNESLEAQTTPGHLPARPEAVGPAREEAYQYEEPERSSPDLPGLLKANRDGVDRACIGGTVSYREANGWSQDTSSGSPQPCRANSP